MSRNKTVTLKRCPEFEAWVDDHGNVWAMDFSKPIKMQAEIDRLKDKLDAGGGAAKAIVDYLELRDTRLSANDGPARDSHEGCEKALRNVYLIATGKAPSTSALFAD